MILKETERETIEFLHTEYFSQTERVWHVERTDKNACHRVGVDLLSMSDIPNLETRERARTLFDEFVVIHTRFQMF